MNNKDQPIIITGMHRSGTSLTAGLLAENGVQLGERLMHASESNPTGHFENLDFVNFHRQVLRANGIDPTGWLKDQRLELSQADQDAAGELIAKNQCSILWGFKDPRTTLFLDFWKKLLPNAKFVFVYRPPWEVIDSLFRRAHSCDKIFHETPKLAVDYWLEYNQRILDFVALHPECSVVANAQSIVNAPTDFLSKTSKHLEITLPTKRGGIANKSLLNTAVSSTLKRQFVREEFPEVTAVLSKLERVDLFPPSQCPPTARSSGNFWLKEWAIRCLRETEISKLEKEVDHLRDVVKTEHKELRKAGRQMTTFLEELQQKEELLATTQHELALLKRSIPRKILDKLRGKNQKNLRASPDFRGP